MLSLIQNKPVFRLPAELEEKKKSERQQCAGNTRKGTTNNMLFSAVCLSLLLFAPQQTVAQSPSSNAQPQLSSEKMEQLKTLADNTRQTVLGYMAASSTGWTSVKEDNGIRVFSRKSPDFAGKIFKVEVDSLPGTPEQIFDHAYPTANAQRLKWDTSLKENKVIKTIQPNSVEVLYTQTAPVKIGFVEAVSSRDFCDIVSIEKTPGRISTASQSVASCSDIAPEKDGIIRGHNYANGLTLQSVEGRPNETRAVQLLHTDLKGSLPTWVVEAAIPGNAVEFFKTVRKHLVAANSANNVTPPPTNA